MKQKLKIIVPALIVLLLSVVFYINNTEQSSKLETTEKLPNSILVFDEKVEFINAYVKAITLIDTADSAESKDLIMLKTTMFERAVVANAQYLSLLQQRLQWSNQALQQADKLKESIEPFYSCTQQFDEIYTTAINYFLLQNEYFALIGNDAITVEKQLAAIEGDLCADDLVLFNVSLLQEKIDKTKLIQLRQEAVKVELASTIVKLAAAFPVEKALKKQLNDQSINTAVQLSIQHLIKADFEIATTHIEQAEKLNIEFKRSVKKIVASAKKYYQLQADLQSYPEQGAKLKSVIQAQKHFQAALRNLREAQWNLALTELNKAGTAYVEANQQAKLELNSMEQTRQAEKVLAYKQSIVEGLGRFVSIPAGEFVMGNKRHPQESPEHKMTIAQFNMMEAELTWQQYNFCIQAGACPNVKDEAWGRGLRPVINLSFAATQQYILWLNSVTEAVYRLPTEGEWEYAARAGSSNQYSWGNKLDCTMAEYGFKKCGAIGTVPVKSFAPNIWGLYDMHGNVAEWVSTCWRENYLQVLGNENCTAYTIRGGSWFDNADALRSTARYKSSLNNASMFIGFRLVRE